MIVMARRLLQVLAAVAAILFSGSVIAGPLPTDSQAISGWQGSASFLGSNGPNILDANVEFAVYAPGSFSTSSALGFPADPSGGASYVYAYEIFNDLEGNAKVTSLSVHLEPGSFPANITDFPGTPELGLAPAIDQFVPAGNPKTSAKWSYVNNFSTGLHSDILVFTSPFAPHDVLASMIGGSATGASALLPSPVPEPATIVLACSALLMLCSARLIGRARGKR